jgi:yecA family protein
MSYHEIQGLMFAVSSAPRPVEPLEWVPLALGPAPPAALEERQPIIEDLMALYREIEARDKRGVRELPPDCPLAPDPMANFDPASPVCQWSRGVFAGHNLVAGSWASVLKVLIEEDAHTATELSKSTLRLLFFSSRELADTIWKDGKTASIEEAAAEVQREFHPSMVFYAELGKGFREQLVRRRSEPVARVPPLPSPRPATTHPGVGRNEPCPCGSGKKYKKCCGGVMH